GLHAFRPSQEDVARSLHHALSLHYSLTCLRKAALRQVILQDRSGRLLDLQEQWVLLIATLEQHDEGARADAADADDLPGHVDDFEAFEQVPPIRLQRGPGGGELLRGGGVHLVDRETGGPGQITQRDDDRRLADDPVPTVDLL